MIGASALPSLAPVPAATVPLACSCDELQRAQQRLQALVGQCSERLDRLQLAFEQLPTAASFDPFAVAATASVPARPQPMSPRTRQSAAAGGVGGPSSPQRRSAGDGDTLTGTLADALAGTTDGAQLGRLGAAAATSAGPAGARAAGGPASLTDWLGSMSQLAALGGEQMALLMQRHAAPPFPVELGAALAGVGVQGGEGGKPAVSARQRQAAGVFAAELGTALSQALQAITDEPRAAPRLLSGLAQGFDEALAAAGGVALPRLPAQPGRSRSSPTASAPQLLEQLLAQGLGAAVAGAIEATARPAQPPRQVAPRAESRLMGALAGASPDESRDPGRKNSPDAPAAASLNALDAGEAMAQQISRLLLDQAWMRGVDLR